MYTFRSLDESPQKRVFDHQKDTVFPDSMRIVDYRKLSWSENNKTVFFGIKEWEPAKKKAEKDSTKKNLDEDLDPSNVEVWHWKDDYIQPRKKVMAQ
jgi:hypothetical protein